MLHHVGDEISAGATVLNVGKVGRLQHKVCGDFSWRSSIIGNLSAHYMVYYCSATS